MISGAKRIVVKIGSALLINAKTGQLNQDWLDSICSDIAKLHNNNKEIVLVSSGAIGLGRMHLSLTGALSLSQKQACAAVGQVELTRAYERALSTHDIITAQALLTLYDTEDRRRWLNARSTMETLLSLGAVPIVNENDTVATDEIRYGDNDRLAARVAQMVGADCLILLSDIDGLYTADPRSDPDAVHLPVIQTLTPEIMAMGGKANAAARVGTGGMATKLLAAKIAVDAGCAMIIMDGGEPSPLSRLEDGAKHTLFLPNADPVSARAQWILGTLQSGAIITIDAGAVKALMGGGSLLPAGITAIDGEFNKGTAVRIIDATGRDLARGLPSYSAEETTRIMGRNSREISGILGYDNGPAVIHRDNMVLMHGP